MASWETGVTASDYNAGAKINDQMQGRNRTNDFRIGGQNIESGFETNSFENSTRDIGGWLRQSEYNIVGIDGNQIGSMRDSIAQYVTNVQRYLESAIQTTEDEIAGGLRGGDAEKAVKDYMDKVKEYITNLVSKLNHFSDKLADVGNKWVEAQAKSAQTVNTDTGNFSAGSAYSDEVQYKGASR